MGKNSPLERIKRGERKIHHKKEERKTHHPLVVEVNLTSALTSAETIRIELIYQINMIQVNFLDVAPHHVLHQHNFLLFCQEKKHTKENISI